MFSFLLISSCFIFMSVRYVYSLLQQVFPTFIVAIGNPLGQTYRFRTDGLENLRSRRLQPGPLVFGAWGVTTKYL